MTTPEHLSKYEIHAELGRGAFFASDTPQCSRRTTVRRQPGQDETAGLWSGSSGNG